MTAKGMAMAHRSGLQRGAILNLRCTSLEATLRRSLGEMTPKQRQDHAKGSEITLSKPTGSLSSAGRWQLVFESLGECLPQPSVPSAVARSPSLRRSRVNAQVVMPDAERKIMANTRARLQQRRS